MPRHRAATWVLSHRFCRIGSLRRRRLPLECRATAMLNWIWAAFFLIAFVAAVAQALAGRPDVLRDVVGALFDPLFRRLFPGIPDRHPASGAIVMNLSANVLRLDNAATPLGLKSMKELQTLNHEPDIATNDMIMFMVINASSVTLLPISIFALRAQLGAKDPTDGFIPILLATYCGTMCGLLVTAAVQRVPKRCRSTRPSSRARRKGSRWRSGSSPTWSQS